MRTIYDQKFKFFVQLDVLLEPAKVEGTIKKMVLTFLLFLKDFIRISRGRNEKNFIPQCRKSCCTVPHPPMLLSVKYVIDKQTNKRACNYIGGGGGGIYQVKHYFKGKIPKHNKLGAKIFSIVLQLLLQRKELSLKVRGSRISLHEQFGGNFA